MIVFDVNLLKIILTSFFIVNHFANVALVKQKYFFKCIEPCRLLLGS
jgi:hypothetical protein